MNAKDTADWLREWAIIYRSSDVPLVIASSAGVEKAAALIEKQQAENERLRAALENIAVDGCGMLSMPAAVNHEPTWNKMRIAEYEKVARQALGEETP